MMNPSQLSPAKDPKPTINAAHGKKSSSKGPRMGALTLTLFCRDFEEAADICCTYHCSMTPVILIVTSVFAL